ncbi:MAG: 5-(carboxyamino)imidazole ribonucleotide synthase [Pseudomonadota bacterium]
MNMNKNNFKIAPGDRIGILGGGQLGRMLAMTAARLGIKTIIFSEEQNCPAGSVADELVFGSFQDANLLDEFSRKCSVVTYEFENIPLSVVNYIATRSNLYPGRDILAMTQDRLSEKSFLKSLGLPVADFTAVSYEGDIKTYLEKTGAQGLLKTRRQGYDGKGQVQVPDAKKAVECYYEIKEAPAVLEDIVPFEKEFSVIGVRTLDGTFYHYDISDNEHVDGVLKSSVVPTSMPNKLQKQAVSYTKLIAEKLNYVGVIVVEYFLTKDQKILVNEIAPRVHNSGHWTIDACVFDQFEQHIRAICGWPVGCFDRHSNAKMLNLLGDDVSEWHDLVSNPNTTLHIYGKSEMRAGRKMGHATTLEAI